MNYNTEYLDVHYAMMDAFMINAPSYLLDVSYTKEGYSISIQVVLLDGTKVRPESLQKLKINLPDYNIYIKTILLTKEKFNKAKGEWKPNVYNWLDKLLFSKSEIL